MSQSMWYLTRSTGIVATLLAAASLLWGFLFSARATGRKLRPNWWLDLHNWLGGLALTFVGVHILTSLLYSDSGIGLLQVFVPGTADFGAWGIGWGVIAAYLFAIAVFTTWPRRLRNRRWWRVAHLGSVIGMALALVHAYQSGSDASRVAFKVGIVVTAAVASYALGLRVFSYPGRRRSSDRASRQSEDSQRGHS
jgi:methionine sulfoxide reductase heme-binding subunit